MQHGFDSGWEMKYRTLILAAATGVAAAGGALAFRIGLRVVEELMFGDFLPLFPSENFVLLLPIVGALIAGFVIFQYTPENAGHGIPETMRAIGERGGRMKHRVAPLKIVVSSLTIGSGGSGGREGPIARIGSGVGSSLGQLFNLDERIIRLLSVAGLSAGIAATFNTPLGGIIFGLEVLCLRRIKIFNVGVISLATLTAVAIIRPIFSHFGLEFLPVSLSTQFVFSDILYAIPYGIIMGFFALIWIRGLYGTEVLFDKIRIPPHLKPALGAIPVGLLGAFYFKFGALSAGIMGVGYEGMGLAFKGTLDGLTLLSALAFSKMLATCFTIGSGGSAGVFSPSLYMGGVFALGLQEFFHLPINNATAGLVGMAAMFSGAAFAPITSAVMVSEMFNNYALIPVLFVPCFISYLISSSLHDGSIYTARLRRKGILERYQIVVKEIGL